MPDYIGVERRLTFSDGEQYTQAMLDARTDWRRRMALYNEFNLIYEIQGHSMPGTGALSGRWIPLVEGNIVAVNDTRNKVQEKLIIESVTRTQGPAPTGTRCTVVLRKLGLLGG